MTTNNLISLESMNNAMKDSVKEIHIMQYFCYENNSLYHFSHKTTLNDTVEFKVTVFKKPACISRAPLQVHLLPLHEEQPEIKLPKYKHLLELLQFILSVHHEFCHSIPHKEGE
jgi:hypothetical protein